MESWGAALDVMVSRPGKLDMYMRASWSTAELVRSGFSEDVVGTAPGGEGKCVLLVS